MRLREITGKLSRNAGLFWPYVVRYKRYYLGGIATLLVVDLVNLALPLILGKVTDHIIAGGSRREPCLYDVYLEVGQRPRDAHLLAQGHAETGALLAVPQRGIEYLDLAAHSDSPDYRAYALSWLRDRFGSLQFNKQNIV